jgi:peroxiredoxin
VLVRDKQRPTDGGGADARGSPGRSPVLLGHQDFDRLVFWAGTTLTPLQGKLDQLRAELRQSLDPNDRAALGTAIERLQVLQIIEHGLAVGEVLPDFALQDAAGRTVTSEQLLANGPLVLVFVRGTWCPYCSLTLQALDEARPAIERLQGSIVVVSPLQAGELSRVAGERGLGLTLLSDLGANYASVCGVHYDMSEAQAATYQRFGLDLARLNAGSGWGLPVPATYVAGRDGVVTFAHAHPDWARRAEPAEIVAAVERLAQAAGAVRSG